MPNIHHDWEISNQVLYDPVHQLASKLISTDKTFAVYKFWITRLEKVANMYEEPYSLFE